MTPILRRFWVSTLALLATLCLAAAARSAVVCTAEQLCGSGTGPCTISGAHDVQQGCHLDFGNRTITLTGTLQAQATGNFFAVTAGSLTLDNGKLRSPGTTTEGGGDIAVTVAGLFRMQGAFARIDTGATAGAGEVQVTADVIDLADGKIIANGGGTENCGDGGGVTLLASGAVNLAAGVDSTGGADCGGGTIAITGSSITVSQSINASGGDASFASIELTATGGAISTLGAGAIRASGAPISIDTGGSGGTVVLSAATDITLDALIEATGALVDGSGGVVEIYAGEDVTANEIINADGLGASSFGGEVYIEAGGAVSLAKDLRARGGAQSSGGTVDIAATGAFSRLAGGAILADGGLLGGGFIDIASRAHAALLGTLRARGSNGGRGGTISIEACLADVRSPLDVTSAGSADAGTIDLRGGAVTVAATGAMLASGCPIGPSCNSIEVRVGVPLIDPLATLSPLPSIGVDPAIDSCCGNATLDLGETCDDGNAFSCDGCSRACLSETTPPCPSDGNACTSDCSPTQGCVHAPLTNVPCAGDGNACTDDVCNNGTCTHPTLSCNDGIYCTIDSCDTASGCKNEPSDARCADATTCTTESCEAALGCVYDPEPDGTPCTDDDVCTTGDACQGGACVTSGTRDCDDDDPCTSDTCSAFTGCLNLDDPAACPCTFAGSPLPAGTACADGSSCTAGESCDGAGNCAGGETTCDDGDPCTTDQCVNQLLCSHVEDACTSSCLGQPDGTPCSDGDTCTQGTCQGGSCVSEPLVCDDGDACNGTAMCIGPLGCRTVSYSDPSCSTGLDSFLCYRSTVGSSATKFAPIPSLPVTDVRAGWNVSLKRLRDFCVPANVAGDAPDAPAHRDALDTFLSRDATGSPPALPLSGLQVVTAFGSLSLDLTSADRLRVPTAFDLETPPGAPVPPDPDAFRCYRARLSGDAPAPPTLSQVPVEDAFGALTVDVRRPTRLCFPADVDGGSPGAPGHPDYLACFQVRTSKGFPGFARQNDVPVENLFGASRRDATRLSELCVPATVAAP